MKSSRYTAEQTFYRWKKRYVGMGVVEEENR